MNGDMFSARLLLAFAFVAGCTAGERTRDVTFQVAAPANPAGACSLAGSVPDPCVTVQAYDHETGASIPLVRSDDAERATAFKLRFQGSNARVRFDLDLEDDGSQRVDLRVVVYEDDGVARYGAFVEDIDPRGGSLLVRLYPFREWACPGDGAGEGRALHAAVDVGDDRVLVFGGVSGEGIDAISAIMPRVYLGATLADSIVLYDGHRHEFVPIDGTFSRVLFDTVVRREPAPDDPSVELVRIRVVGGFSVSSGPVLHFDSVGRAPSGAPLGTPMIVPAEGAEVPEPVELVFDPRGPSVTIEDAPFDAVVPRGAATTVSSFLGSGGAADPALVVHGIVPAGTAFEPSDRTFSYLRDGSAGEPRSLAQARLGASIHPTGADSFFVWGGNVLHGSSADGTAGEVVPAMDGDGVLVPARPGERSPTAFHSSTALDSGLFLVAGGYSIGSDGNIGVSAAADPIAYLEIDGTGVSRTRPVVADGYINTAFHSATRVEGLGVLLAGGAGVVTMDAVPNRLFPQEQVALVDGARYESMPVLSLARWGHTATPLSGHRVLVVGGFTPSSNAAQLDTTGVAEMLFWDEAPRDLESGECGRDQTEPDDASVTRMDGGLPPVGDAGRDGGVDAGFDAGMLDADVSDGAADGG